MRFRIKLHPPTLTTFAVAAVLVCRDFYYCDSRTFAGCGVRGAQGATTKSGSGVSIFTSRTACQRHARYVAAPTSSRTRTSTTAGALSTRTTTREPP